MQPVIAAFAVGLYELFPLAYIACVIGAIIYVLSLLTRFVGAHERIATSLDVIARKLKDEAKP